MSLHLINYNQNIIAEIDISFTDPNNSLYYVILSH